MTFLNPLALFGLAAAAVPILLHLLNLRKLRRIDFSSLAFLKELRRTHIRRLKVRQWILLALRTALVALLVLALARPTLKGALSGLTGSSARTSAVILLDDTPSMTVTNPRGELFAQGQAIAQTVLRNLTEGDQAAVLPLSAAGTGETSPLLKDLPLVRRTAAGLHSTLIHRTLEDGLRTSARILGTSRDVNRELYVVSDFQARSVGTPPPRNSREDLFPAGSKVFLVPFAAGSLNDAGIDSVWTPDVIVEPNRPLTIVARVRNNGTQPLHDHVVSVFVDGRRAAQRGTDIAAGGTADVEFTVIPQRSGFLSGTVELENDDVPFNNSVCFPFRIPERVHVVLVGKDAEMRYLRLALESRQTDSSASIQLTATTAGGLSAEILKNADVVVLVNPGRISPATMEVLSATLRRGGGIVIFAGAETASVSSADGIEGLGAPRPEKISGAGTNASKASSFMEFSRVDMAHPIFRSMFEQEKRTSRPASTAGPGIESPEILRSVLFASSGSAVLISLTDGSPFLLETRRGSGRILTLAVPPTTDWSDFPLRGLFVPLVDRTILYAAHREESDRSLHPDETAVLPLPPSISGIVSVSGPGGMAMQLSVFERGGEKAVNVHAPDVPGIYRLTANSLPLGQFAVNVDKEESGFTPASDNDIARLLEHLGVPASQIHSISSPDDAGRVITESRYGTELWRPSLLLALLVALAELLVARETTSRETRRTNTEKSR